jgi:hypothetical protein
MGLWQFGQYRSSSSSCASSLALGLLACRAGGTPTQQRRRVAHLRPSSCASSLALGVFWAGGQAGHYTTALTSCAPWAIELRTFAGARVFWPAGQGGTPIPQCRRVAHLGRLSCAPLLALAVFSPPGRRDAYTTMPTSCAPWAFELRVFAGRSDFFGLADMRDSCTTTPTSCAPSAIVLRVFAGARAFFGLSGRRDAYTATPTSCAPSAVELRTFAAARAFWPARQVGRLYHNAEELGTLVGRVVRLRCRSGFLGVAGRWDAYTATPTSCAPSTVELRVFAGARVFSARRAGGTLTAHRRGAAHHGSSSCASSLALGLFGPGGQAGRLHHNADELRIFGRHFCALGARGSSARSEKPVDGGVAGEKPRENAVTANLQSPARSGAGAAELRISSGAPSPPSRAC